MNIHYSDKVPTVNDRFIDTNIINKIFELKNRIDKINDKGKIDTWIHITKLNNLYENVPFLDKKRRINRAFYKMLEIHKKFKIFHLERKTLGFVCESPGGFIECARNIKQKEEDVVYLAQSLKESECHFCNKIKKYTKIFYGPDYSGDILKEETIKDFVNKVSKHGKCDVMTGDGGFDVSENYIKQEQLSFRLIFCQIVTNMGCLKKGGDMICKIFESYTLPTVELIFILKIYFEHVFIFKPLISRPCNSERYIIAKDFRSISSKDYKELLDVVEILKTKNVSSFGINLPENFVKKIKAINNSFAKDQIESFNKVFYMYDNVKDFSEQDINLIIEDNNNKCNDYINVFLNF
jgi:23S rRNA U2552 (ribose-2'-O)-methylase RlmE/FtsJ